MAILGHCTYKFADQLQLTADQRQRIQQLYDTMKVEAIAVGEGIIAIERNWIA